MRVRNVPATERSLQLSRMTIEHMMSQIVEAAPNGVAVTARDGRILLANAEFERMFGLTRTQLLNTPIDRLVPARFRRGHAKLREGDPSELTPRSMGEGRELMGLRANGIEFPIEIGINALMGSEGRLLVERIADISLRKRLEAKVHRVVKAAPCAILMIDARDIIVLVNDETERMFGYARSGLIGCHSEMLLPERFRAAHGPLREALAAAPAFRQIGVDRELHALRSDGSEFPVEIALNPLPAKNGGLVLAAVTDITRHNDRCLALQHANANLQAFTYAASHDLKSPLRGIADLVEWIGDDLAGTASTEVRRNLGRVTERVERMSAVIDELLAYAHAGPESARAESIDLRSVVDGILELIPHPHEFQISVQIDVNSFVAHRAPLESVLRNLIDNAMKHHDKSKAQITVRAKNVGQYCVVTVSDDGPGIPLASQEQVFRMFETSPAGERDHSGVGLALTKRLVEAHGGRIELESTDGIRGAAFNVWWPAHSLTEDV